MVELVLNRLTPLYFEIYYKEEKLANSRDCFLKYITPPYSKGLIRWYINILVGRVPTFLRF